jgi:hypothetical protein
VSRVVPIGEVGVGWSVSGWADRPSPKLQATIDREGQIVPLLVVAVPFGDVEGDGVRFMVTDSLQAERFGAIRKLGWGTVLVETDWTEDDL